MYILAMETTGKIGSAAVMDPAAGTPMMEGSEEERSHLKNLMPLVSDLLRKHEIKKEEIGWVAASVGPGSYTGIRIGVASARAFAQAMRIPCIAVPTLDSFRIRCRRGDPAAVIFNARRGQVYGAVFDEDGKDILKPGPYMLQDVTDTVRKNGISPVFYGDGIDAYQGIEKYKEMLEGFRFAPRESRYQTAAMTAEYAALLLKDEKTVEYPELLPDYMRETEAEQRLRDGSLERARKAKMAKFMSR